MTERYYGHVARGIALPEPGGPTLLRHALADPERAPADDPGWVRLRHARLDPTRFDEFAAHPRHEGTDPMYYSAARVPTDRADRYVKQLISHLGHKAATELAADGRGTITLGRGACSLIPSPDRIDLIAKADDAERLASVEDVVGRHLVRFATHDELTVDWAPLVRQATDADDAALLALDRTAWTAESGFPSYLAKERTAFFGEEKVTDHVLVAYVGGELVGYVGVMPKAKLPEAAHVFTVRGLAVAPAARRLGVASALLAAAERVAAQRGARKLSLQVLGGNTAATRLYERHGYSVEGRFVDEFLIDGWYVDDVNMAKTLSPAGGPTP